LQYHFVTNPDLQNLVKVYCDKLKVAKTNNW
jgi:hypothetical protein